jgi:hypothetical protein
MSLTTRTAKGSKLTIAEMDGNLEYLQGIAQQGDYLQNPSQVELIETPNDYIGWKQLNQSLPQYQSVEVGQSIKTESIEINSKGAILFTTLDETERFIYVGDIITITNSTIPSNNGEWKVASYGDGDQRGDRVLQVVQTIDRKLATDENINLSITFTERKLAELNYPQAQLEDGTLIWEAYTPFLDGFVDPDGINGYWVAMKPNSQTGEFEYVSHLKMSENFWNYWYNYTAKIEGEPNSIRLTTLTNGVDAPNDVGSAVFKLTLNNGVLSLEENIYDLEKTFRELYLELTGLNPEIDYSLIFSQPWYCSDNDWYGMMAGPQMGWYWIYDVDYKEYYVGYNMLTGETQLIDISESILDIKNINYFTDEETPEGILFNALKLITSLFSHSKYGLLLQMSSNGISESQPTAFWSPNYTNVEYATIVDTVDRRGELINVDGNINGSYSLNTNYLIQVNYEESYPRKSVYFTRIKLDEINNSTEYSDFPIQFDPNVYATDFLYNWERENSFIISPPYNSTYETSATNDKFFVWRNDESSVKYVESPAIYPQMLEDDRLTDWYRVWNNPAIVTVKAIYNKNTF